MAVGKNTQKAKVWNGMEYMYVIWAKCPALGPLRSFSANRRREKRKNRTIKHPVKLVEAAACFFLSPLTTTTGWILRGGLKYGTSYLFDSPEIECYPYSLPQKTVRGVAHYVSYIRDYFS